MRIILSFLLLAGYIGFSQADESFRSGMEADIRANAGNNIDATFMAPSTYPSWVTSVRYVANDGVNTNDGLTPETPLDANSAFNSVVAGRWYWIKAGNYSYGTPLEGQLNSHYNLTFNSNTSSNPIAYVGYKSVIGDLDRGDESYAGVTWTDYLDYPLAADGLTHSLDTSEMPTFSGNQTAGPNYILNGKLFKMNSGVNNLIFKNLQIQYMRMAFTGENVDHCVFDNIVVANMGWFTDIKGQGGSNNDLQGDAFDFNADCDYNEVRNCAVYNVTFRATKFSAADYNLIKYTKTYSNIDEGNPQDYYFHTTGRYNWFHHVEAYRLADSNHSGHGICFNQKSNFNLATDWIVEGTDIHLDGGNNAVFRYGTLIAHPEYNSYVTGYKGGAIVVFDNGYNSIFEDIDIQNAQKMTVIKDGGEGSNTIPPASKAGHQLTYRNITATADDSISTYLYQMGVGNSHLETPIDDVLFDSITATGFDSFILSENANNGFVVQNSCFKDIPVFETLGGLATYGLNTAIFMNNTLDNSFSMPSGFVESGTTIGSCGVVMPPPPLPDPALKKFKAWDMRVNGKRVKIKF